MQVIEISGEMFLKLKEHRTHPNSSARKYSGQNRHFLKMSNKSAARPRQAIERNENVNVGFSLVVFTTNLCWQDPRLKFGNKGLPSFFLPVSSCRLLPFFPFVFPNCWLRLSIAQSCKQ